MAQVDVTINDRSYRIACDDGQDGHLTELANYVDGRVQELVSSVGQVGDARLLVMASLLIADELSESLTALNSREGSKEDNSPTMEHVAQTMENLAAHIERIAARLEAA
ncbi:MAG: cell division protein ZapA [Proteobacteria bacterium]|nr:cell division protein ZapA [Pseudomonadota bacterium]